jgi:hypothetical protein
MPISFTKYVDITSGVAGASQIAQGNFGGRIMTPNHIVSADGVLSFTGGNLAAEVGAVFGTASEEYARAVLYAGFVSVFTRSPQTLQFARWQREATPVAIYGASNVSTLAAINLVVAGVIKFLIGGVEVDVTGIDLAADASLTAAAATLQTALQANANPALATATVTYDPVMGRFNFAGSSTDTAYETISIKSVGGGITDVALAFGWDPSQLPIYVSASPIVTPVNAFIATVNGNNNFGTFLFIANGGTQILLSDAVAIATQNHAYNVRYKFIYRVDDASYAAAGAALATIGGTSVVYYPDSLTLQYQDMQEMMIQGATDFTQLNGASGYMYVQFDGFTPAVTTDTLSTALDALNINYYGQTQVNGTDLQFYQDGVMMGGATDPVDSNVYANEQWLKSYAVQQFMSLQLALVSIGANTSGLGLARAKLTKTVIPAALNNGVISIGKPLDQDQILYITQATGDNNAWQTVQNNGVWYALTLSTYTRGNGSTGWQINYTLIYSKDDLVRKVVGTHTLI